MELTDLIFSSDLQDQLQNTQSSTIFNVPRGLEELYIAGALKLRNNSPLIWILDEDENFEAVRKKTELWIRLLGHKSEIFLNKLPFEDPYINRKIDRDLSAERLKLQKKLHKGIGNSLIISSIDALSIKFDTSVHENNIKLCPGMKIRRDEIKKKCGDLGYIVQDMVAEPGEVSYRGSITDIFPYNTEFPVRIELEGKSVLSLRYFDPFTQLTVKECNKLNVTSVSYTEQSDFNREGELYTYSKKGQFLTDLLSTYTLFISDCKKQKKNFASRLDNLRKIFNSSESDREQPDPDTLFSFRLNGEYTDLNSLSEDTEHEPEIRRLSISKQNLFNRDIQWLKERTELDSFKIIFENLNEKDTPYELKDSYISGLNSSPPSSLINRVTKTIIITDREFSFTHKRKEIKSSKYDLLEKISEGDPVVHKKHGIGKFRGLCTLEINKWRSEFIKLEYQGRDILYIPVTETDILAPYSSEGIIKVESDKLGGKTWDLKKKRAQKSIVKYAEQLLQLYAQRKAIRGDSVIQVKEIEEEGAKHFPYELTTDQKKALKDMYRDLEAPFPMDRLICGDVSFGKTEIALRGALRTAANSRQVILMCPTTILAMQHYRNFCSRLRDLPFNIELLCRMTPEKERKRIKRDIKEGRSDIIIGTHSILGKNIEFSDPGLFIIDEEQRFGVFQKERLKERFKKLDFLTLSATPIPRTLSLSMAGLYDVSTIETPPAGRREIKNSVALFSGEIITSAIKREMSRKGQVFIILNNTERIFSFSEQLKEWMPDVRFRPVHAQMKSSEIEKTVLSFINREIDVLVSTTIIENGIDIPAVNTIIVINAENFGLTQLYQLRGRIGRGSHQGYALFLVNSTVVSEKAEKRLHAIREFSSLGAGFRIAEYDLRLRGAGTLLGNRQHGHIEALGFDFYMELLNKTVKELRGEVHKERESELTVNFPAMFYKEYINRDSVRIKYYKKLTSSETPEHFDETVREIEEIFGKIPEESTGLLCAALTKTAGRIFGFSKVTLNTDEMTVEFFKDNSSASPFPIHLLPEKSFEIISQHRLKIFFLSLNELFKILNKLLQHIQGKS